jgi:hypothetical protein
MKAKLNKDYTVNKFPYINDPYCDNYEVHGQGQFNGKYQSFRAESRGEALREAKAIVANWCDMA